MIGQLCRGIEGWVKDAWRLQRDFPDESFSLDWTGPRRPLIDPNDEIDAEIKAVDAGIKSRQSVQRKLGLDPDQMRRERAEDATEDAAAKLAPVEKPDTKTAADSKSKAAKTN